jgi:dTDP-4-amino-4,6-dideoxygalactose transaminase
LKLTQVQGVRYSYLAQQFSDCEDLWQKLREFVKTGDFTLGEELNKFEKSFAGLIGTKYAVGVNSGTDAIKLSLKALGVGHGDEVITAANTFVATVGAINELGAIPVFVDCNKTFCMDVSQVRNKITEKTRAILPVHFSGYMTNMPELMEIAAEFNLPVVEDACQGILASIDGKNSGTWGITGAFSLHPLKNINVWSDGGVIVTDDEKIYKELLLLRNHGLSGRDTVDILGFNSRLDTFQAIVGSWLLPQANDIANKRISNAAILDEGLREIPGISLPERRLNEKIVYHLYMFRAENRDELLAYLLENNIEAKIHYPIPIYRQRGLSPLGLQFGDFPQSDEDAKNLISLPCDQHLTEDELLFMIHKVEEFYSK